MNSTPTRESGPAEKSAGALGAPGMPLGSPASPIGSPSESLPMLPLRSPRDKKSEDGETHGFAGYSPFGDYLRRSSWSLWNYNTKITWMLVFVPIAFFCKIFGFSEGIVFFTSLLGLIPLAALLGATTESLACYTNQTLGGLLNATFGNATEVIISLIALGSAGPDNSLLRVVQLSLLGSILSNLLLVLGCAFLAGGIRVMTVLPTDAMSRAPYKNMQRYNETAASTNSAMLMVAVTALLFPDVSIEQTFVPLRKHLKTCHTYTRCC